MSKVTPVGSGWVNVCGDGVEIEYMCILRLGRTQTKVEHGIIPNGLALESMMRHKSYDDVCLLLMKLLTELTHDGV